MTSTNIRVISVAIAIINLFFAIHLLILIYLFFLIFFVRSNIRVTAEIFDARKRIFLVFMLIFFINILVFFILIIIVFSFYPY